MSYKEIKTKQIYIDNGTKAFRIYVDNDNNALTTELNSQNQTSESVSLIIKGSITSSFSGDGSNLRNIGNNSLQYNSFNLNGSNVLLGATASISFGNGDALTGSDNTFSGVNTFNTHFITASQGVTGSDAKFSTMSGNLGWNYVQNTPTTLSGYSISDAVTLNTEQDITGRKTFTTFYVTASLTGSDAKFVSITGSLSGDGSQITNLTASNIDSFTNDVRAQFTAGTNITINNGEISAPGDVTLAGNNTFTGINTFNQIITGSITGSIAEFTTLNGNLIGNASTATILQTTRNINGTSFNGSANITTSTWGMSRNITIGNTTRPVNGSGNYNWSLSDIGAAGTGISNTFSNINIFSSVNNQFTGSFKGDLDGNAVTATTATTANSVQNEITFNNSGIGDASGTTYDGNLEATISYNTIGAPKSDGTGASGTWGISITGNAATATQVSQTLTRGSYLTGNNYNGSSATTWAVDATTTNTGNKIVARDAFGSFSANTITANQINLGNSNIYLSDDGFFQNNNSNAPVYIAGAGDVFVNIDCNNNDVDTKVFAVKKNTLTTGGSELFRIEESGDVGIGTTSPEQKLHVQGTILTTVSSTGNNDNIEIRKTSAVSTSNISYIFSHRSNGQDLWLYGSDGAGTFKNFLGTDWTNNKIFFPANGDDLVVDMANNRVGINQASPGAKLHIKCGSHAYDGLRLEEVDSTAYWDIYYGSSGQSGIIDDNLYFSKGSNYLLGGYLDDAVNVANIDFTGQHRSLPNSGTIESFADKIGLIVVSSGEYINFEGYNGININEALPKVKLSDIRNQKSCFGVISDSEDPNTEGRVYHQGRWASLFEKSSDDNRLIINSLGEGGIWVTNINGNLENGDYITTCEIPGYGMKQDDDLLHNYTVAKITCDCDFNLQSPTYICEEFEWEGQIYRRAFVGCTYHCG